jgi:hypothetical protein
MQIPNGALRSALRFRSILVLLMGLGAVWALSGCRGEDGAQWAKIRGSYELEAIDSFLVRYPQSRHRAAALEERGEAIWRLAEQDRTVFHYLLYAHDYPNGPHYEAAFDQVSAIPVDGFGASELRARPFTGKLGSDTLSQYVRLEFREVRENGDSIRFTSLLNFAQVRNTLEGYFLRSDNSVHFERSLDLPGMVVQTPGRLYRREGRLVLESTDLSQYWRMAQ